MLRTLLRRKAVEALGPGAVDGLSNPTSVKGRQGKVEPHFGEREARQARMARGASVRLAKRGAPLSGLVWYSSRGKGSEASFASGKQPNNGMHRTARHEFVGIFDCRSRGR